MIRHLGHAAIGSVLFLGAGWLYDQPFGLAVRKAPEGKLIIGGVFACLAVFVIASVVLAFRASKKRADTHTSPYSFLRPVSRKGR